MPHEAERMSLGLASSMRLASSFDAKPPKTTEWTAPMRAHARMATPASGTLGMETSTRTLFAIGDPPSEHRQERQRRKGITGCAGRARSRTQLALDKTDRQ